MVSIATTSKRAAFLSIFLALFLFGSCSETESLSEKDRKEISLQTKEMLEHYCNDVRQNGLLAEFRYLDTSSEFYWIPPGFSGPVSFDSVAGIIKINASHFQKVDNAFLNLEVFPLTPQFASYNGVIHSIMTDTSGKKSEFDLVESGLLIKRSDGWKLFQGQTGLLGNRLH